MSEVAINACKHAFAGCYAHKKSKALADRDIAERLFERASGSKRIEQKEVKLKRTEYADDKKVSNEEWVEVVDRKKATRKVD